MQKERFIFFAKRLKMRAQKLEPKQILESLACVGEGWTGWGTNI